MVIPIETLHYSTNGNIVNILVNDEEFLAKEFTLNKGTFMKTKSFRELCISMRLKHPNIITSLGIVRSKNNIYLLLEKGDCDCLTMYKNNFFDNRSDIESLLNDVSEGLMYLHNNNISHCDLSMRNIVVKNKKFKIIDFGNAIKGHRFDTYTDCTPYISTYDKPMHIKVDVWALGCLSYLLFTKTLPFFGFDQLSQARMISQMSGIDCNSDNKLNESSNLDVSTGKTIKKMLNINSKKREIVYFSTDSKQHCTVYNTENKKNLYYDVDITWKLHFLDVIAQLRIENIKMENIFIALINLYKVELTDKIEYVKIGLCFLWLSLKLTTDECYISDLCEWINKYVNVKLSNNEMMMLLFDTIDKIQWSIDESTVIDFMEEQQKYRENILYNSLYMYLNMNTAILNEKYKYAYLIDKLSDNVHYIESKIENKITDNAHLYVKELISNKN